MVEVEGVWPVQTMTVHLHVGVGVRMRVEVAALERAERLVEVCLTKHALVTTVGTKVERHPTVAAVSRSGRGFENV